MLSPVATFRGLRGAAERLACDVVTEVEPRPGGQASAVFVLPPSSASRARARVLVAKFLPAEVRGVTGRPPGFGRHPRDLNRRP
jgi:hypothetical protein